MTPRPVMCAFCGETVAEVGADPCALVVVAGWRGIDQREQQFSCHAECLRTRLHPDVVVHADVLA